MWLTIILGGILLFLVYRLAKYWVLDAWFVYRHFRSQGIPGRYIPIVGDLFRLRRALITEKHFDFFANLTTEFGDYYLFSWGPVVGLFLSDPLLIQGVLRTNVHAYHKSTYMRLVLNPIVGYNNLGLAENDMHAYHRRLIAPAFHHQNLNSMISFMVETASRELAKLTVSARQNQNNVLTIDVHKEMVHLTLKILGGCIFGMSMGNGKPVYEILAQNISVGYTKLQRRATTLVPYIPFINRLPLPRKLRIESLLQQGRCAIEHIIDERKKGLTKSACKGLTRIKYGIFTLSYFF
jgi:cytochrome P450